MIVSDICCGSNVLPSIYYAALLSFENIRKYHHHSVGRKVPPIFDTVVVNFTNGRLLYMWIFIFLFPVIYFKSTVRIGDPFTVDCTDFYDSWRYVALCFDIVRMKSNRTNACFNNYLSGMFFVLALLAWLLWTCPITQTSHKHNKSIGIFVFILISFAMILTMATIFASCIVESWFLGGNISYPLRGEIACSIDQSGSCTLCPDDIAALNYTISTVPPEDQCPEWSLENVTRVLQSQAKTGANLAIICMFYAIGAFRYGLTVRKHILNYKIAYV